MPTILMAAVSQESCCLLGACDGPCPAAAHHRMLAETSICNNWSKAARGQSAATVTFVANISEGSHKVLHDTR